MNIKVSKNKIIAHRAGLQICDSLFEQYDIDQERFYGLTNGLYSLISIIHAILKKTGKADVVISTWSAGFYDIHAMDELKKSGLINNMTIVIDRSYKSRQSQYSHKLEDIFGLENIRTTNTHAKFVLISNDKYNITVLSSMNLNENKRCESFQIEIEKSIYDLFYDFVKELFTKQSIGIIESREIVDKVFDDIFDEPDTDWRDVKLEW